MRTDTNTGACTTVFQNQTVSVGLAGARLNPTGGASQLSVLNSGGSMQAVATGAGAPGAYTNVSLAFDAQSKAPLVLSYPDAGSVQLYASYALPAPPAATTMTGSSNAFVVRPFGLRVSGVTTAASPSPASPVFAKAGAELQCHRHRGGVEGGRRRECRRRSRQRRADRLQRGDAEFRCGGDAQPQPERARRRKRRHPRRQHQLQRLQRRREDPER